MNVLTQFHSTETKNGKKKTKEFITDIFVHCLRTTTATTKTKLQIFYTAFEAFTTLYPAPLQPVGNVPDLAVRLVAYGKDFRT